MEVIVAWILVAVFATAFMVIYVKYALLARAQAVPEKRPLKILIVEDEPVARIVILKACARLGYSVVGDVSNGLDAWRILNEDPTINVLITDLQMPGLDGSEQISLVESLPRKVFVLVISGTHDPIKNHAFLEKPVSFDRLLHALGDINV